MNLKVLFALIGLLIVAVLGYSQYSSAKHEEQLAAIKAETQRAQAETASISTYQSKPMTINKEKTKEDIKIENIDFASTTTASVQQQTLQQNINIEPIKPISVEQSLPENNSSDAQPKDSGKKTYYAASAQLNDLYKRWGDAEKLAGATPRINLAAQIGELQKIKQELEQMKLPNCQSGAKEHLNNAMQLSIDSFYSFSLKEPDSAVQAKTDAANKEYKKFNEIMRMC